MFDLFLFDAGTNSRSNTFEEGADDVIYGMKATNTNPDEDPFIVEEGSMIRLRGKGVKEAIIFVVQATMDETLIFASKGTRFILA